MVRQMLAMKSSPENEAEFPGVLDPGTSDEAYRRNRRIELKLTER